MKLKTKNIVVLFVATAVISLLLILGYKAFNKSSPSNQTQSPEDQAITEVSLTDSGFNPQTVTVKKGTRVVWTNNTTSTASINSADHPTHTKFIFLNLDTFEPGATLGTTVDMNGTFQYHNHLNPTQTGVIIVK
jgi:plastocyanin